MANPINSWELWDIFVIQKVTHESILKKPTGQVIRILSGYPINIINSSPPQCVRKG